MKWTSGIFSAFTKIILGVDMFDGTLFAGAIDEMVEGHFLRMYD